MGLNLPLPPPRRGNINPKWLTPQKGSAPLVQWQETCKKDLKRNPVAQDFQSMHNHSWGMLPAQLHVHGDPHNQPSSNRVRAGTCIQIALEKALGGISQVMYLANANKGDPSNYKQLKKDTTYFRLTSYMLQHSNRAICQLNNEVHKKKNFSC